MKLTDKELQEFWEWCGFKFYPRGSHDKFHRLDAFLYPNGTWHSVTPPIDLNNLFKYAVPKLEAGTIIEFCQVTKGWVFMIGSDIYESADEPAQALYQAIQKARGKDK